jgi:hypothetical protein
MPQNNPLPAGPALDRAVCLALTKAGAKGWEPRIEWWISNDGGHSFAIGFARESSAVDFMDNPNHPHRRAGYKVIKKEWFDSVSEDPATALRALEAMREMKWLGELYSWPPPEDQAYSCRLRSMRVKLPHIYMTSADTPSHAIALAILAALEGGSE